MTSELTDSEVTERPLEEDEGIEARGIERVSLEERDRVHLLDNFTLWLSANLVISTVAIGTSAINVFKLGFWDGVAAIAIFNTLGILPVAFFSTLGPKLGLRQMTISRFSFGWGGAKIMALFNIVACIGWLTVNVLFGGQLVYTVSNGIVPSWIGILVIAAIATWVSVWGYKAVHRYERFAWVPMLFIFSTIFYVSAPDMRFVAPAVTGVAHLASFISFGGAVYGFATGWSSYAADYNVNQPENTPSTRIFWLTFLGVFIPCVLLETLGLALTTVPALQGKSGGLLFGAAVTPMGLFGALLLVLLALSVVANTIPNNYSFALSMQVLGRRFQRIDRAVWTLVGTAIYLAIALCAADKFDQTLKGFLLLIGYWLGPWSIILILEHFVFRRGEYNIEDWNNPKGLPRGKAAIASMAIGLTGALLGAAQEKFVGPIAGLVNPSRGMDVGFELGIVFAGIAYLLLRRIELKRSQRDDELNREDDELDEEKAIA
jgi:NCS1 nucleoside transporter family